MVEARGCGSSSRAAAATVLVLITTLLNLAGCAYTQRDAETGTTEIWGFGHLQMTVPPPAKGKKGIVQGVTMCGLAVGYAKGSTIFATVGWDDQELVEIVDENTAITCKQLPHCTLLNYRCLGESSDRCPDEPRLEDNTQEKKEGP